MADNYNCFSFIKKFERRTAQTGKSIFFIFLKAGTFSPKISIKSAKNPSENMAERMNALRSKIRQKRVRETKKMKEQRRHFRAKTLNLLSYECIGEDGFPLTQGMGKILDISQGGLLLETKVPIEAKYILLTSLDIKEELLKIKGEVVYCREPKPKTFHTGVQFIETSERIRKIVAAMIKVFLKTKTEK